MPSTLRYEQREAALEEYVQREALAVILRALTAADTYPLYLGEELELAGLLGRVDGQTADELSNALWNRLWPDEPDERAGDYPGSPEEELASARAASIAAAVLARLAASPAILAVAASRLSAQASRGLTPEVARA